MILRHLLCGVMLTAVFAVTSQAGLFHRAVRCTACAPAACEPVAQCVEKTIMVPQFVTEMRTVRCREYEPQQREYTVNRVRWVRETETVERKCTEWVREERVKEVTYTVCKPVWVEETRTRTVMVPKKVTVEGTRKVCKMVPVEETRTVCVDEGHWEERPCKPGLLGRCRLCRHRCQPTVKACCEVDACAPACTPAVTCCTCKVWVPNIVKKEVTVTCHKPQWTEEPCTYTKVVCEPVEKEYTVRVCKWEKEEVTRECKYTVCVPKEVVKPVQVVRCRKVVEPITKTCTVMVPKIVEKEVPVRVCKMVPKTIQVPVCPKRCGLFCRPRVCCPTVVAADCCN